MSDLVPFNKAAVRNYMVANAGDNYWRPCTINVCYIAMREAVLYFLNVIFHRELKFSYEDKSSWGSFDNGFLERFQATVLSSEFARLIALCCFACWNVISSSLINGRAQFISLTTTGTYRAHGKSSATRSRRYEAALYVDCVSWRCAAYNIKCNHRYSEKLSYVSCGVLNNIACRDNILSDCDIDREHRSFTVSVWAFLILKAKIEYVIALFLNKKLFNAMVACFDYSKL